MANEVKLWVPAPRGAGDDERVAISVEVVASGDEAGSSFEQARGAEGAQLLCAGARSFHLRSLVTLGDDRRALVQGAIGRRVLVEFEGRAGLRCRLREAAGRGLLRDEPPALNLTEGMFGAAPLLLRADGTLAASEEGAAPRGLDALDVMVNAARWVSSRRTTSFECLFPPSAFHPEQARRADRLSPAQGEGLLGQLEAISRAAAPTREEARAAGVDAVQLRSAVLTVLSHVLATALKDPGFRALADRAAAMIFALIDAEVGAGARPELRAHAIQLLSQRGPALSEEDRARVVALQRGYLREAPPYDELGDTWRFAFASAYDFHPGEYEVMRDKYSFAEIEVPEDAPAPPGYRGYKALEAPFTGPKGQKIQLLLRATSPRSENFEMGEAYFVGHCISRHANLGSNDMAASTVAVEQRGYKLQINCQCAGLTTRFAISRMFPEADIYSSWDSTYFRTDGSHKIIESEACDCFHAILQGFAAGESFVQIDARIREAQWYHKQNRVEGFVQFVGPAHRSVVARYEDINHDGKADYYDGFLDFTLIEIAEDTREGAVPRDPGVAASQVSGAAARGLGWSAGSLNRVTQYSELWDELPGEAERFYAFRGAGFYSPAHPPSDVPTGDGPAQELGRLPAVVRYLKDPAAPGGLVAEVMYNSWLSHTPQELKRLLIAADAWWRAVDLGHLGGREPIDTIAGQRGGLLLLLASLLEYPADQNRLGQLWERALDMLNLPPISRSLVRKCNTDADHNRGNYYGSRRGVRQLLGDAEPGELERGDPLAYERLLSDDPTIGRARLLDLELAAKLARAEAAVSDPATAEVELTSFAASDDGPAQVVDAGEVVSGPEAAPEVEESRPVEAAPEEAVDTARVTVEEPEGADEASSSETSDAAEEAVEEPQGSAEEVGEAAEETISEPEEAGEVMSEEVAGESAEAGGEAAPEDQLEAASPAENAEAQVEEAAASPADAEAVETTEASAADVGEAVEGAVEEASAPAVVEHADPAAEVVEEASDGGDGEAEVAPSADLPAPVASEDASESEAAGGERPSDSELRESAD